MFANLLADTETGNVHVDGFLKVSDAGVYSSEIVERTRLRVRHVAEIKIQSVIVFE